MSSSSFLEIVELSNGEIVLRRADEEKGEALVKISFSNEAKDYLGEYVAEVGKAMIGTGVEMVGKLYDQVDEMDADDEPRVLH